MLLPALQTSQKRFTLLELDLAPQVADGFGLDLKSESAQQQVLTILGWLQQMAQPLTSGLVYDPVYSYPLLNQGKALLSNQQGSQEPAQHDAAPLIRLEKIASETDPLALPTLIHNWGIEQNRQNYAAAKIELLYHPREAAALSKKQLIAELHDYAQHEGIAFLLKLMIYTPAGEQFEASTFQQAQLEAVSEFRASCDLMALQYPHDPLAAATITAELDIPWVHVAQKVTYDQYKELLRTVLDNGATGFLLGQELWQEIYQMRAADHAPDMQAIEQFIQTTARDRVIELGRIVGEGEQL